MALIPVNNYFKYLVSEEGVVQSITTRVKSKHGTRLQKGKSLKPHLRGQYLAVRLYSGEGNKNHSIHRLVAEHFLDDFSPELQVNHKDGNKLNNRKNNLEMVTQLQNSKHASAMGLLKGKRGSLHYKSKISEETYNAINKAVQSIPIIKGRRKYGALKSIAQVFGVNRNLVSNIARGCMASYKENKQMYNRELTP